MYALDCTLKKRPTHIIWDLVSGLLYQFHSAGIDEGEEPAPEGEKALVAANENEFESALEPGVLSPPERFIAYFENLKDAEHAQTAIASHLEPFEPSFAIREMEDKDYSEIWKQNFKPISSPPFWRIRAPWHNDTEAGKNEIPLIIEPGMAFGTGSHETTRGCLELMVDACLAAGFVKTKGPKTTPTTKAADAQILDFGCGSGILAIGLKLLGLGHVHGVDIDPLSIDATHANAERNGVKVTAALDCEGLPKLDGIVANILKNTLLDFSRPFYDWLKPGAFLILSGLLAEQKEIILERYRALGFKDKKAIENNNWVSLWLERN